MERELSKKPESRKYPLLNDSVWLKTKYVDEKLSTKEIAVLVGAKAPNSVRQALLRSGIPVRNVSEGLTCKRDDSDFIFVSDVVNGCLLGDGYLQIYNSESDISNAYFAKGNIFLNHIKFVAKQFYPNTYMDYITEEERDETRETKYIFRTPVFPIFREYYFRWYPKRTNNTKVIPDDVKVTKELLLHWFLDDGSSYRRKGTIKDKRDTRQIIITMCSEGFAKEEQELLCKKINDEFDIHAYVRSIGKGYGKGTGYRIEIGQSKADKFYDLIGPPPFPEMAYKWK